MIICCIYWLTLLVLFQLGIHNDVRPETAIACTAMSGNTAIERKMETEFDLRLPRDFKKKYYSEYLSVRQQGFGSINRFDKRGNYLGTDRIGNWELFAIK